MDMFGVMRSHKSTEASWECKIGENQMDLWIESHHDRLLYQIKQKHEGWM